MCNILFESPCISPHDYVILQQMYVHIIMSMRFLFYLFHVLSSKMMIFDINVFHIKFVF